MQKLAHNKTYCDGPKGSKRRHLGENTIKNLADGHGLVDFGQRHDGFEVLLAMIHSSVYIFVK